MSSLTIPHSSTEEDSVAAGHAEIYGNGRTDKNTDEQKRSGSAERINHPPHYTMGGVEAISVIDAWKLNFYLGNVLKYICRAGKKENELEDLQKAAWYLNRYVTIVKNEHRA